MKKINLKKWTLKKKSVTNDEMSDDMLDVLNEMDMEELHNRLGQQEENVKKNWNDDEKIQKILDSALSLVRKLSNLPLIGSYIADVPFLVMMVNDYRKKEYTSVPLATIVSIVAALAYLVSPIDLIPDAIPLIGYLDDFVVLKYIFDTLHNDIADYRMWKAEQYDE